MKEQTLSSSDMLMNIGSMRSVASKLLRQNKSYSNLLEQILQYDCFDDEDKPIPSIKDLARASNLKYAAVRKQILAIYKDLVLDHEVRPVFSFSKVSYSFFIRGLKKDKILHVEVEHLPIMPRVGEEICLPFFSAYMGTSRFHVEKVEHEFGDGTQEIVFWLREGYYNSYWHYRKDKAKEENELGVFDFFELNEFELKRKLKVGER